MSLDRRLAGSLDRVIPCQEWLLVNANVYRTFDNYGVAYAECQSGGQLTYRVVIDLARIPANQIRLYDLAAGNEAGNGKGIQVYDVTNAQELCSHTWNGAFGEAWRDTGWVALPANVLNTEITITLRVKASSATEDMQTYCIYIKLRRA